MGGMNDAVHRDWLATYLLAICSIVTLAIVAIICKERLEEYGRQIGIGTQRNSCINCIRQLPQAVEAKSRVE